MRLYFVKPETGMGRVGRVGALSPGVTVTPGMQAVAQAIQTEEGYAPGTVSYQNNNPGNLVYAGQPGATPGAGGFADFATYQDGLDALYNQLNLYANGTCGACNGQPLTIEQMTAIYAPAGQGNNNPTAYAQNIASATGVSTDTPLSDVFSGTAVSGSTDLSDLTGGDGDDDSGDGTIFGLDPVSAAILGGAALVGLFVALR